MKVTATRDKFSGHWWIKLPSGLTVEAYRYKNYDWELCGVYGDKRCWFTHKQLDPKRNIVYPYYRGQAIPSFCSLRAIVNWVESIP